MLTFTSANCTRKNIGIGIRLSRETYANVELIFASVMLK